VRLYRTLDIDEDSEALDEYHRMGETGILGEDDRAVVWSQNPLLLVRYQAEPQPDVMLLAPRWADEL